MLRVPGGRRVSAGLLLSMMLIVLAILPGSGLSGSAAAAESCPDVVSDDYSYGTPTCYLDIEGAPESVVEGAPFDLVVNVEDQAGGAGEIVTDDCVSTTFLAIFDGEPFDTEALAVVQAVAGVAEFSELTLSGLGAHVLTAAVDWYGCEGTSLFDDTHAITVIAAPAGGTQCPPTQACTSDPITSPSGETKASITAGPGANITAAFSTLAVANYTACSGTEARDAGGVLTFDATGTNLPKLVRLNVLNGRPIKVCWNAPEKFKKAGGGWSGADPKGGFTAILPNCLSIKPTLPCMLPALARRGAPTIDVYIIAPAGDPKAFITR